MAPGEHSSLRGCNSDPFREALPPRGKGQQPRSRHGSQGNFSSWCAKPGDFSMASKIFLGWRYSSILNTRATCERPWTDPHYRQAHTHVYTYTLMNTQEHKHACTRLHTHVHTGVHMHTWAHTCRSAYMQTHTHRSTM